MDITVRTAFARFANDEKLRNGFTMNEWLIGVSAFVFLFLIWYAREIANDYKELGVKAK